MYCISHLNVLIGQYEGKEKKIIFVTITLDLVFILIGFAYNHLY